MSLAQLRKVLSAIRSKESAQEHQHHGRRRACLVETPHRPVCFGERHRRSSGSDGRSTRRSGRHVATLPGPQSVRCQPPARPPRRQLQLGRFFTPTPASFHSNSNSRAVSLQPARKSSKKAKKSELECGTPQVGVRDTPGWSWSWSWRATPQVGVRDTPSWSARDPTLELELECEMGAGASDVRT